MRDSNWILAVIAFAFFLLPSAFPAVGLASWYGEEYAGRATASGERFDPAAMTAACWEFPLGTVVEVRNLDTGKSVVVRINDRGPALSLSNGPAESRRVIDLSRAAFREIADLRVGLVRVEVKRVNHKEHKEHKEEERIQ